MYSWKQEVGHGRDENGRDDGWAQNDYEVQFKFAQRQVGTPLRKGRTDELLLLYTLVRSCVTMTGVEHRPSSATVTRPIVKDPANGSPVTRAFVR